MPLAHILAPQIMRRAQQIEADLGHGGYLAQVQPQGYLAQGQSSVGLPGQQGHAKTEYDPRGLMDKPSDDRPLDMNHPRVFLGKTAATLRQSGNPYLAAAADGVQQVNDRNARLAGTKLIPTAPPAAGSAVNTADVVGMREDGTPIYASDRAPLPKAKKGKGGKIIIQLDPGVAGMNESGQGVAAGGKNLGYLRAPVGGMRTAERKQSDYLVSRDKKDDRLIPKAEREGLRNKDAFSAQMLQRAYGKDAEAMMNNRDENGMPTDQFPPGYFNGVSAEDRENIEAGVRALRMIDPNFGAQGQRI